jgi:hypothetical protein
MRLASVSQPSTMPIKTVLTSGCVSASTKCKHPLCFLSEVQHIGHRTHLLSAYWPLPPPPLDTLEGRKYVNKLAFSWDSEG